MLLTFLHLYSQTPTIQWQKSLGGSGIEQTSSIQQTSDGAYIVSGRSYSNNGDVTGNHGVSDFWIVKLSLCSTYNTTNNVAICQGDSITIGTNTYFSEGTYTDTLQSVNGCDSIVTTFLTINNSSQSAIDVSSCDTYLAPDGQTFDTSGVYTSIIPNTEGCDSIISIDLTVNSTYNNTITVNSCESYTAPDGQVYTESGTYLSTFSGSNGCDSIITVNLTIKNPSYNTINPSQCSTYTAPDGQVYTQSGVYTAILNNAQGCDSIISINLSLFVINTAVLQDGSTLTAVADGADSYQWIKCSNNQIVTGATEAIFNATQAGSYAVIVTVGSCSDTSECFSVSLAELSNINKNIFEVYPNPSDEFINISINNNSPTIIKITDLNGRLVYQSEIINEKHIINIQDWSNGVYNIELNQEGNIGRKRFVKN